jgi:methylmalonyl-CoA/ethylmalonyl-CoA epimerase
VNLDHVAIAAADHRPVLRALTGDLGALVLSGGVPPKSGFRAMQVRIGRGDEGMTVEILEPYRPEDNDFLVRFIESTGGGVHHITFKTDDVVAARKRLQALGVEPVGVNFKGGWKEMFIHPRDAHGTVIQIAQSDFVQPPMDQWLTSLPDGVVIFEGEKWWDGDAVETCDTPATLRRVVIATPDVDAGLAFYRDILGGVVDGRSVFWDGGEVLLEPSDVRPCVSRLEVSGTRSATIGGVSFANV